MKNTIKVNFADNTIEVEKSFLKKVSIYGTKEYNTLQNAKRENPGFIVKVVETKSKRKSHKGLTHEVMRNYIKNHDDDGSKLVAFELRIKGFDTNGLPLEHKKSYGDVKRWFFDQFPEVEAFYTTKTVA
jgi:hypothetical protein